jgi:hypothetical protein
MWSHTTLESPRRPRAKPRSRFDGRSLRSHLVLPDRSKACNPRTGAKVLVPEKCVVTFKPGHLMQERVEALGNPGADDESAT